MKSLVKTVSLLICVMAVLSAMPAAPSALSEAEPQYGQIAAEDVNLREEPNTDSEILKEMPLGERVEILAQDNGWYRVISGDVIGYVRQDYLFFQSVGSRAAYVTDDGAKLRGAPSQTAYLVNQLRAGQGVQIKQMVGEWYFIIANDEFGYVHRTYLTLTNAAVASVNLLKSGMEGQEVRKLQQELNRRGFLNKDQVTGIFGSITRKAVVEFQKLAGVAADGIAGNDTLDKIYDTSNNIMKENATYNRVKGSVILLNWFKGGSEWLHKGARFTITDVKTGLSFNARRFGGWYHADSEPILASDTATMLRIAGGKWSWNRRAIWITYNGKTVAASMHCMPHLANPTPSNNFDGHFCIHLEGSKVHENSKECPRHQACVREAYSAGKSRS